MLHLFIVGNWKWEAEIEETWGAFQEHRLPALRN